MIVRVPIWRYCCRSIRELVDRCVGLRRCTTLRVVMRSDRGIRFIGRWVTSTGRRSARSVFLDPINSPGVLNGRCLILIYDSRASRIVRSIAQTIGVITVGLVILLGYSSFRLQVRRRWASAMRRRRWLTAPNIIFAIKFCFLVVGCGLLGDIVRRTAVSWCSLCHLIGDCFVCGGAASSRQGICDRMIAGQDDVSWHVATR